MVTDLRVVVCDAKDMSRAEFALESCQLVKYGACVLLLTLVALASSWPYAFVAFVAFMVAAAVRL